MNLFHCLFLWDDALLLLPQVLLGLSWSLVCPPLDPLQEASLRRRLQRWNLMKVLKSLRRKLTYAGVKSSKVNPPLDGVSCSDPPLSGSPLTEAVSWSEAGGGGVEWAGTASELPSPGDGEL